MDSGNSGSMHSSSAGEQEYDSRAPSLSLPPSPPLFDPFSHSYNNQGDLVWPSFQNTLANQSQPSSSLLLPALGTFTTGTEQAGREAREAGREDSSLKPASRPDQPVKNSRKRTRASRRAPTTVLTTDTSNFRQMVQEFTGIPAPPFSAAATSSSPYSRRLDLFSGGSLGQYYPFRPSAQKLTPSPIGNAALETTMPVTSCDIFPTSYNNQVLPNNSDLRYNNSLENQLLSRQAFVFGSSKNQGNIPLGEMGITQEHINANLSAFLGEGKGIGRENNGGGVQDSNVISTRIEKDGLNSWNYSQDFSS